MAWLGEHVRTCVNSDSALLRRNKPASKNASPGIMPNTRTADSSTHAVSPARSLITPIRNQHQ